VRYSSTPVRSGDRWYCNDRYRPLPEHNRERSHTAPRRIPTSPSRLRISSFWLVYNLILDVRYLVLPSHAFGALRLGRSHRYAGYPSLVLGSVEDGWMIIKQDARSIGQPRSNESRATDGGPPLLQKRHPSSRLRRHWRPSSLEARRPAPCGTAKNATRRYKHTPQRSINAHKTSNGGTLYTRAIEYSRKLALKRNPPGFYAIEQELRHQISKEHHASSNQSLIFEVLRQRLDNRHRVFTRRRRPRSISSHRW
jgi:hypothetical protein